MVDSANLRPDGLTIDQLAIFVTVVDEGSFSAAARRMNRAQSVITYGVQHLEGQIGTDLFDRSAYRPTLTPAGIVLLPLARRVLEDTTALRKMARNLRAGVEARLHIAIDVAAPWPRLIAALSDFSIRFPTVEVTMRTQPLEETVATLRKGDVDLGIIVEARALGEMEDLDRRLIDSFRLLPVAASTHPLARLGRILDRDDLKDHMQLLLSATYQASGTKDLSAFSAIRWRVNNLSLRHACILQGLGWGRLPEFLIDKDLAEGTIVVLPFDQNDAALRTYSLPVSVATLRSRSIGPAGRWLIERMATPSES